MKEIEQQAGAQSVGVASGASVGHIRDRVSLHCESTLGPFAPQGTCFSPNDNVHEDSSHMLSGPRAAGFGAAAPLGE